MKKVNSDVAYEFIRGKILNGEYTPGYSLMTEALSGEIGVSRTPVREAFHRLKADGLVSISPHLGASVTKMSLREFREMCDLRLALEEHAAGLAAANRSDGDLSRIKHALESMRELTDQILEADSEDGIFDKLVEKDVHFHIAIMTAAKNELMKSEILRLHLVNRVVLPDAGLIKVSPLAWSKVESKENRRRVLAEHDAIFSAIGERDSRAAKIAMEQHIQDIINKNLNTMAIADGDLHSRVLTEEELAYGS